jgi:outer membrane receptor protein involved in Fe transport
VRSDGIDLHTAGSFDAFGRSHQLLLGAMWSRQRTRQSSADLAIDVPIDVYAPDHSAIAQPLQPAWDWSENARAQQSGVYSNLRLQLAEPLHLTLGGRLSWVKYQSSDGFTGLQEPRLRTEARIHPVRRPRLRPGPAVVGLTPATPIPSSRRAPTSPHPVRCWIPAIGANTSWA